MFVRKIKHNERKFKLVLEAYMMDSLNRRRQKGFTLVEAMIVTILIAVLSAAGVGIFQFVARQKLEWVTSDIVVLLKHGQDQARKTGLPIYFRRTADGSQFQMIRGTSIYADTANLANATVSNADVVSVITVDPALSLEVTPATLVFFSNSGDINQKLTVKVKKKGSSNAGDTQTIVVNNSSITRL